jgi:hypothetical protein
LIRKIVEDRSLISPQGFISWKRAIQKNPDLKIQLGMDNEWGIKKVSHIARLMIKRQKKARADSKPKRVWTEASPKPQPQDAQADVVQMSFCPHCGYSLQYHQMAYNVAIKR